MNTTISGSKITVVIWLLLFSTFLFTQSACIRKNSAIDRLAFKAQRDKILDEYPKVPHDEILQQVDGNKIYNELKETYTNVLIALKGEIDHDSTYMAVVILTPEVGKSATLANRYGIPFIVKSCENMSIPCFDLSTEISKHEDEQITQMPHDGHWSKEGAQLIANLFVPIIQQLDSIRSPKKWSGLKTETYGDLDPNLDDVLDGEKNMPFHVKANAQGLRMNYNLTFPKKKQRILILGDSQVFSPFLDNDFIWTTLLQKQFPDKEIINAGMISYTLDDYESLYRDKAKYCEADVVLVCSNGGDVLDHFFSQRNRFSRTHRIYRPSEIAKEFYNRIFKNI
jgi:hypothetical protein